MATQTESSVEAQGPSIDRVYLERWARQLGVDDLLERALAEAQAP